MNTEIYLYYLIPMIQAKKTFYDVGKDKNVKMFVEVNRHIMKKLNNEEIDWILKHSDKKLDEYFNG